jgi:hypothetical protein
MVEELEFLVLVALGGGLVTTAVVSEEGKGDKVGSTCWPYLTRRFLPL